MKMSVFKYTQLPSHPRSGLH